MDIQSGIQYCEKRGLPKVTAESYSKEAFQDVRSLPGYKTIHPDKLDEYYQIAMDYRIRLFIWTMAKHEEQREKRKAIREWKQNRNR